MRKKQDLSRVPDGIRASATGRVPQWVLDEAAGLPVESVPFRAPTLSVLQGGQASHGRGPSRRRALAIGWSVAAVAILGVVYLAEMTGPAPGQLTTSGPQQSVKGTGPTLGKGEAKQPLGAPPTVPEFPEGQGYRFLAHQDNGKEPITWSPCRPIRFVTRPDNTPVGGAALITSAVAEVSAATGLRFEDGGPTTELPSEERKPYQFERYGDRWAPVLVAWATGAEIPEFGITAAGKAGGISVNTGSGDATYVSGVLYLDPASIDQTRSYYGEAAARKIIVHELGHLVGLAHVDDPKAVMHPEYVEGNNGLSPGDRAGLAALGRGACQPDG